MALCPVVVGRDDELRLLEDALAGSAGGKGALVFVTGEPGIGKSRLVRELAGHATRRGALAVTGRAVPAESGTPYRPLTEASMRSSPIPRAHIGGMSVTPRPSQGSSTDRQIEVTWSMSGDLGHELPKRCSRPGGVLTTELTGPDHGNSLVLENYHAARSHGPSDYIYDPAPGSLRRSLPVCSRHADVTRG